MAIKAPDQKDFESHIVTIANSLAFLPPSMRSRAAETYITELDVRRQRGMLDFWNLGVATLVFKKTVPDRLESYSAQVQRSTWAYSLFTLRERFIDVGFLGSWRYFERNVENYDVGD
jgi:hypothetical protein